MKGAGVYYSRLHANRCPDFLRTEVGKFDPLNGMRQVPARAGRPMEAVFVRSSCALVQRSIYAKPANRPNAVHSKVEHGRPDHRIVPPVHYNVDVMVVGDLNSLEHELRRGVSFWYESNVSLDQLSVEVSQHLELTSVHIIAGN